jgi:cytochrome c peroxidase
MHLHRWLELGTAPDPQKAQALAAFLRVGLTPPPSSNAPLDALAEQGKKIFEGRARCSSCHATGDAGSPMGPMAIRGVGVAAFGFDAEPSATFKVPSLRFVSGTAPYFHDGSAKTLEQLIDEDHDRMGHTSDLTADERAALVAYLRTL